MITENPLTWQSYNLDPDAKDVAITMKLFQGKLSNWANQIQQTLTSPILLASILNSTYLLMQADKFVQVNTTPTTNQTLDTLKAPLVFINYVWATAANFTLTINNVVDGQLLQFRLQNTSGAARTITILANTPSSVAITVGTANNNLSLGVSVANNTSVDLMAMASATNLFYAGVGQNW